MTKGVAEVFDVSTAQTASRMPCATTLDRPGDARPMQQPMVSIVIPVYNRSSLIASTIQSAVNQSYGNIEVIVVDDGSTDDTPSVLARQNHDRLECVTQANSGVSVARNAGFQMSHGELVLFLDSDDELIAGAVSAAVRCLAFKPDVGVLGGSRLLVNESDDTIGERRLSGDEDLSVCAWARSCPFIPSSTFIRRSWLLQSGGFDPETETTEDWDLFLRLAMMGCPMMAWSGMVCRYRIHTGSASQQHRRQLAGALRTLDKAFSDAQFAMDCSTTQVAAYARVRIWAAACAFGQGDIAVAQDEMRALAALLPAWVDDGRLVESVLLTGMDVAGVSDQEAYDRRVIANLPEPLDHRRIVRRAKARLAAGKLYSEHLNLSRYEAIMLWCRAVTQDMNWLLGQGLGSALGTVLLGAATKERVRATLRFGHRDTDRSDEEGRLLRTSGQSQEHPSAIVSDHSEPDA